MNYNYIIILALFLIYVYGITSIFGSINLWSEKKGAGKIKQSVLDWGYKYSIYWTNFVGLWLSGTLQCIPLVVVSPWYLLGGIGMPICYSLSYYFGREPEKYYYGYQLSIENGVVPTRCTGLHIWIFNLWFITGNNVLTIAIKDSKHSYNVILETYNLSEWSWGFVWGCLMLAAVIGG